MIPHDDVALRIERGTFIDDEGEPVILAPGHLILASELHTNRLADCL